MASMLGGSGAQLTQVGVRGAHALQQTTQKKVAKKSGPEQRGPIDEVTRDGGRNAMLEALADEEEEEQDADALIQPPGHRTGTRRIEGDAFRKDPRGAPIAPAFSDVDQGNLGDAWLLAACAAIAHARPGILVERVEKHTDGSFTVTLGEERIRLSPELPNEPYADPTPNGQRDTLWVALIEKAFAFERNGSYQSLEQGNPGRALEAISGRPATRVSLSERTKTDRLWSTLLEAKKSRRAMVLRTREADVSQPLHQEHAYAVLDLIPGKQRGVRLYNPWGTKNNSRPLASMIHEISLEQLRADGEALFVCGG